MIVTSFSPKHGNLSVIIESADDLWLLRRLIRKGDTVVTRSSRVVKQEDEFSRPDKGERVKVTIALEVEQVHLDRSVERIRVRGTIREASDDVVSKTGTHSISLSAGHTMTLKKEAWGSADIRLVDSSKNTGPRFLLVTVDRREAGIGTLSSSHLSVTTTIESGAGGKQSQEQSLQPFLKKVSDVVKETWRDGDTIVIAGPGHTKLSLANLIGADPSLSNGVKIVEGYDLVGSDGIRGLVKYPGFQKVAADTALVEMQNLVNEVVRRVSQGDGRVAYSLGRVRFAAVAGAVEACVVSDDVFDRNVPEEEVVETLNRIESQGGRVHLADSSLEFGKQVSAFGGIVATLRYPLRFE